MQPGDHPQEAEPGAFGEYHSQEGAGDQVPTLSTPVVRSHFGTEGNQRSDSRFAQTRKQASLLEGRSGRLSVVEEHTRMLPGGGEMTWQRTTSPDGGGYCCKKSAEAVPRISTASRVFSCLTINGLW